MQDKIIAKVVRTFNYRQEGRPTKMVATAELHQLGEQKPHFSVTCEIHQQARNNRWVNYGGGCMHEEIAKRWPAIKPVIDLHLSDDDGQPMYAEANGFYDLAGYAGGLGERFHLGNSERHFPRKITQAVAEQIEGREYFKLGKFIVVPEGKLDPEVGEPVQADPMPENWKPGDYLSDTVYRRPTRYECVEILANHLRLPADQVRSEVDALLAKGYANAKAKGFQVAVDEKGRYTPWYPGSKEVQTAVFEAKAIALEVRALWGEYVAAQAPRWKQEADAGLALIRKLRLQVPA